MAQLNGNLKRTGEQFMGTLSSWVFAWCRELLAADDSFEWLDVNNRWEWSRSDVELHFRNWI